MPGAPTPHLENGYSTNRMCCGVSRSYPGAWHAAAPGQGELLCVVSIYLAELASLSQQGNLGTPAPDIY